MKIVVLIMFAIFNCSSCLAQNPESKLKELGFENVDLTCIGDTMYLSVEDPVYRGTFRGAGVALKNLSLLCPSIHCYDVVVKEDNVDKYALSAQIENGHWRVEVDYNSSRVNEIIRSNMNTGKAVRNYNKSVGKVNVTFYPIISFSNKVTYKLFTYGVMLAPAIETSLWKGNRVVVQPILPLFDNYDVFDNYDWYGERLGDFSHFQLGSVTIQQDLADNAKWWGRVYAGFFHYNNLGLNADFGYHLNDRIDIGVKASATRWQDLNDGKLWVEDDVKYSAILSLSYYEPKTSTELKVTGGRYLYGDYGARLDGICHFGEYSIGLYAIYAGDEYNGGFHFSIPVAGKAQKRMGFVSLRVPEFFDWEYSLVNNYEWSGKRCGQMVEPLPARNRSGNYWQARYVQSYLLKYLNGEVE